MAHASRVKCVEISKEKISVNFDDAHVNVACACSLVWGVAWCQEFKFSSKSLKEFF